MLKCWTWIGVLLGSWFPLVAQQIDANITAENRKPSTVAEQIADPAERAAFEALFHETRAEQKLGQAESFLGRFPQSEFLFQVYDIAARACYELADYDRGLDYAAKSLRLLPESPLLLVSTADVEARQHRNGAAISHAQEAVEDLDRFAAPSTIAAKQWPELKRKLKATAKFAEGRARLAEALELPKGEKRLAGLKASEAALEQAHRLNDRDMEITYLLGLAQLADEKPWAAASSFARVYNAGDSLAPKALENLQLIHKVTSRDQPESLDEFLHRATELSQSEITPASQEGKTKPQSMSEYAGSESCRGCHGTIYAAWAQSGMAKMLRPYLPQNVIGDFEKKNQFFLGDSAGYEDGKLQVTHKGDPTLFARMMIHGGRHYFEILESDGAWHRYPVDYTIGSKFQQAYATKLPNGEIHVFPIQYSRLTEQWLNYWKIIDPPGSERADLRSWEKLDLATSYQAICADCHTSQLRTTKSGHFEDLNAEFKETGVNCEMCHGPSAQHVAEMTTNERLPKDPLDPPVNFHDIDNRAFVAICSQCHMQSAIRTPGPGGELNYSRGGRFFLENASIPFGEFSRLGFYKDGRFRQTTFIVEALERSQCFRKGQVSCGTCHNPHASDASSNLTSLKFPHDPDRMCTGCHTQFTSIAAVSGHSHHRAESDGSRCVSCHMPRIMDALLFRARTHQIDDVPDAEMTARFGQKDSPNACLLCHAEKDVRWLRQQMATWKSTSLATTAGRHSLPSQ
jgi:predicted CXXCH cytochrome family protein